MSVGQGKFYLHLHGTLTTDMSSLDSGIYKMWNGTLYSWTVLFGFFLYSAQFFPQSRIHTIRKCAAIMLAGINKPEIPGREFFCFRRNASRYWLIDLILLKSTVRSINNICVGRENYWKRQNVKNTEKHRTWPVRQAGQVTACRALPIFERKKGIL